jgi:hypothetical protein
VNTSLVTGFYEEPDVCIHKWNRHGDIAAVGENVFGMITELLDETEDVILKVSSIAASNIPIDHSSTQTNDLSIHR